MASQKRRDLLEVMCKYNDSSNEFNFTNARDAMPRSAMTSASGTSGSTFCVNSAEKGPENDDDGEEEPEVTAAEALDALKVMERFSLHNRGVGVWADMSRMAKVGMRELRGQIQNARAQKGIEDYFKRA
jgi:hypothetical protein